MSTPGADAIPYATAMLLEGGDRIAPFALPDQEGAAVVWSCSLLHEVLPIASGQRFILGTHLFGT